LNNINKNLFKPNGASHLCAYHNTTQQQAVHASVWRNIPILIILVKGCTFCTFGPPRTFKIVAELYTPTFSRHDHPLQGDLKINLQLGQASRFI
jgi:hypothetical protein